MSGHTSWSDIKRAKGVPDSYQRDPMQVDVVPCERPDCESMAAHTVVDPATGTTEDLCWLHTVKRLGVDPKWTPEKQA